VSVYCTFVKAARRVLWDKADSITFQTGGWLAPGFFVALTFAIFTCTATVGLTPEQLRCEYLSNPLGIDVVQPRLSWVLRSGANECAWRRADSLTAFSWRAHPNSSGMKRAISGTRESLFQRNHPYRVFRQASPQPHAMLLESPHMGSHRPPLAMERPGDVVHGLAE